MKSDAGTGGAQGGAAGASAGSAGSAATAHGGAGGGAGSAGAAGGAAGGGAAGEAGSAGEGGSAGTTQASCGQLDPNKVYLLGNIQEGDGTDSIAELEHPEAPCISIQTHEEYATAIRPDGKVVWQRWNSNDLWQYVPDAFDWDPQLKYASQPDQPEANDIPIPTTACPSDAGVGPVSSFLVNPQDGSVVYRCSTGGAWFDTSGAQVAPGNVALLRLGFNGLKLAGNTSSLAGLSIVDAQGVAKQVQGSTSVDVKGYRSQSDGFWVVTQDSSKQLSLLHVDADGAISAVGTYAPLPTGVQDQAPVRVVLDGEGNAYHFGGDADEITKDLVIKRPLLPAASSVVMTEKGMPQNDFEKYPPDVRVRIHISGLISGQ